MNNNNSSLKYMTSTSSLLANYTPISSSHFTIFLIFIFVIIIFTPPVQPYTHSSLVYAPITPLKQLSVKSLMTSTLLNSWIFSPSIHCSVSAIILTNTSQPRLLTNDSFLKHSYCWFPSFSSHSSVYLAAHRLHH